MTPTEQQPPTTPTNNNEDDHAEVRTRWIAFIASQKRDIAKYEELIAMHEEMKQNEAQLAQLKATFNALQ